MKRFLDKVKKTDGCWEWAGGCISTGYGYFWYNNRQYTAHKVAYMLYRGEIPKGMDVCHSCDNRKCVNPDHLWIGTRKQNMLDASAKGKMGKAYGENHGYHKLTEDDVREIRKSSLSTRELGRIYGVWHTVIGAAKRHETWKHVSV